MSNFGIICAHADVAQLVEHNLAKVGVAGSNPVVRSIFFIGRHGQVVRQRPAKPLSPVRIRMSPPNKTYLEKIVLEDLKKEVYKQNLRLVEANLVVLT